MANITKYPSHDVEFDFEDFDGQVTTVLTSTATEYSWISDLGDKYTVLGNIVYSGGVPQASSQIAQVSIDMDDDGTEDLNVAFSSFQMIMDDVTSGAYSTFWRALLGQSDTFSITGPAASDSTRVTLAGDGRNVFGGETLVALSDTFNITGGYRNTLFGDYESVKLGGALTGANDVFNYSGASSDTDSLYGDARTVWGILTGGNDSFTFAAGATHTHSMSIYGDSGTVGSTSSFYVDASSVGGNDTVDASGTDIYFSFYGDASDVFTTLEGGDDLAIAGDASTTMYGDAEELRDGSPGTGLYFIGGDDTLIGGAGSDALYGDYAEREIGYTDVTGGNDDLSGGAGNDTIHGNEGNDTISGGGDDDTIFGGDGNDIISGNNGNDLIDAGNGDDNINGGAGADTLTFENSFFAANLTLGNNGTSVTVNTGQGTDTFLNIENIIGTNVADTITGNNLYNVLEGGGGNDTLDGGGGLDTASYASATAGVMVSLALQGTAQNTGSAGIDTLNDFERLQGSDFGDTLTGDAGDNVISVGSGAGTNYAAFEAEEADGGDGIDTLSFEHWGARYFGLTVDLSLQGTAQVLESGAVFGGPPNYSDILGTFTNFEYLTGSQWSDVLRGDAGYNRLRGLDGDDTLAGGAEFDDFDGGDGNDYVDYSTETAAITADLVTELAIFSGGDEGLVSIESIISSQGNMTVIGNEEDNTVIDAGVSDDSFDGGLGVDTYSYENAATGVNAYLLFPGIATNAGMDTLTGVENLTGSDFGDRLVGDNNANTLRGGMGDDTIKAKGGDGNFLYGDQGNDFLRGTDGTDFLQDTSGSNSLFGLDGEDTIIAYSLETGEISYAYGGKGDDLIFAAAGDAELNLRGNRGNDDISVSTFGAGSDIDIRGGGGNDTITADLTASNSYIAGGTGNDIIIEGRFGQASNDVMSGGNGGAGGMDGAQDTFVFNQKSGTVVEFDRIKDFEDGIDKIDVSDYGFTDFNTELLALAADNAFGGMEITFASGSVMIVENFTVAQFTADDAILM